MKLAATAIAMIILGASSARAEDLKAFKLTIDGVAVEIDPGEDADVTLPGGKTARVRLDRNDFATFSGGTFSFVHPSSISVTKTDLGESITQYLAASALGTRRRGAGIRQDESSVAQSADAAGDDQGDG
ncbi:cupredoxin domain-containing protein [Mesorhizobium sp. WSM3873]|uniref:cupredoxin domain-containing protein n=1 Tax=Mesorhizobium sp. WSM3873 TaxID=1854056 RepID=UPI001FD8C0C4|nr:cupredoxin domain-containing protein [Mesorhizobium sp. WSM3873]